MRVDKYLPALRGMSSVVAKKASRGERVFGALLPNRGAGWPGGWSTDRMQEVQHFRNSVFMLVDAMASMTAGMMPNFAYVTDRAKPGVTVKACQRGLLNLTGRGFGGSPYVGGRYKQSGGGWLDYARGGGHLRDWQGEKSGYVSGEYVGTDGWSGTTRWDQETGKVLSDGCPMLVDGFGSSFLTVGEYRSKALSVVKPHEDLEPLESDHHLRRLWENPNPLDSSYDIVYELDMFLKLTGIGYLWCIPNDWGVPCELWVIPSHWVWPRTGGGIVHQRSYNDKPGTHYSHRYVPPDSPHADELIHYYEIRPWGGLGSAGVLRVPPNEIVRIIKKSPLNKLDGYSPISAVAQMIDAEESIIKCRWAQMMNQARPELWIKTPAGYDDPDDDKIARLEAKFAWKMQGEYNYGKPLITPPGIEVEPLNFSPTEMAYKESWEQTFNQVCMTFRFPKAALGLSENMTYGSLLATLGQAYEWCINPDLRLLGIVLTKHLSSRWDEPSRRVKMWWDNGVPADPQQVNSDIAQDIQGYSITPNEIRALRGRKSYRFGGDEPMGQGPGGIMPIPMNNKDVLDEWADQVAAVTEATGAGEEELALTGETPEQLTVDQEGEQLEENETGPQEQDQEGVSGDAQIEEPNGKPQKRLRGDSRLFDDGRGLVKNGRGVWKALVGQEEGGVTRLALQLADFVTLPQGVEGTNCGNCLYSHPAIDSGNPKAKTGSVCTYNYDDVDLRGLPVSAETCCGLWDSPETIRAWQERGKGWFDYRQMVGNHVQKRLGTSVLKQWRQVWKDAGPHKYSSTQFNLEGEARQHLLNLVGQIDDKDLAAKGKETVPHVTVLYGLHGTDAGPVRQLVENFGTVEVELGKVGYFSSEEHDVVYVEVLSDDLRRLRDRVAQLEHTDTHADYTAHITIAYIKPGQGPLYTDIPQEGAEGLKASFTDLVFSPSSGEPTMIPLASYAHAEKGVGDSVQSVGRWLASRWKQLEDRYGRKQALAMAVAALTTLPLPGNVAAIVAVAEGIRGISGYFGKEFMGDVEKLIKATRTRRRNKSEGPVNRLKSFTSNGHAIV